MGGTVSCEPTTSADEFRTNMGRCTCFADDSIDRLGKNEIREEEDSVNLSSFSLEPDDVDSLAAALSDLHKAAELFRDGLCTEAAEKLQRAEQMIDKAPTSPSRKRLSRISTTDPDLAELKQMAGSLNLVLPGADKVDSDGDAPAVLFQEVEEPGFHIGDPSETHAKDEAAEDARRESFKQRDDKLAELEVRLSSVRSLCREARIFEAHAECEGLEAAIADAQKDGAAVGDKKLTYLLEQLDKRLKADPVLIKLKAIHTRMCEAVRMLRTSSSSSKSEVTVEASDPVLGDLFRLNLSLRFAEGDERVKDGPSTQIIVRGDLRNLPASLSQVITENAEVDLFRKDWIKDCKEFQGKPGRAPRLFCTLIQTFISPPLLPIKIEDCLMREFAVCKDGEVLPDRGPGVIVIEHRAPDGATEFEGLPIPKKRKGYIRVKGGMTAFYKSQSVHPGCANITAVSTMGLPVPQYLLPLGLLKRFAADIIMSSTKLMAAGLYGKWQELEYSKRTDTNPDFYKVVASLPPDKLGA